jgi:predicted nucleic acid-binding protein
MGCVILDASVAIAHLTAQDAHHDAVVRALAALRGSEFVLPVVAYAELLVGAFRRGATFERTVEDYVRDGPRVEPATAEIGRLAARLRAGNPALKLADALIIATGEALDAQKILTADARWAAFPRVQVLAR